MSDASPETIEERVRFGDGGRLTGMLSYPADGEVRRAVLLCSPHPHFAGDMNNNVIRAVAARLACGGSAAMRFDYRGVGESGIDLPAGVSVFDYWSDVEENFDYADAIADAASAADTLAAACGGDIPMAVVGYSFGAAIGLTLGLRRDDVRAMVGLSAPFCRLSFDFLADCPIPCLLVSGAEDFVYSAEVADALAAKAGAHVKMTLLPGKDHFFRDEEDVPAGLAEAFIDEVM